jgi:SAM-dependent methyltransferase
MYPHRDEKDAAAAISLISKEVQLQGRRVLDLACGPGRHSELLRNQRARVVGFDLSAPLLRRARDDYSPPLPVVRGDMRSLPFSNASFGLVVNLFTSFGYFDTDVQHEAVLQGVNRVLIRNGWFVLDYLNAARVRDSLVDHEELVIGGKQVVVNRWISDDGKYVFKDMRLIDERRTFRERVRLFELQDLKRLLEATGFKVEDTFGNYSGDSFFAGSPRMLLFSVCQ